MPANNTWPLAAHFSAMLQNPKIAFRDPDLKTVEIQKHKNNQPRARSGSFANVYKGMYAGNKGSVAIRVFTNGHPERRERYQAISEYLEKCRAIKSLVDFKYDNEGIRSTDGKWYPLVTMEWIAGETLFDWLRTKCRDNDRRALGRVTDGWVDLMSDLYGAGIAHGDLQHANVMITEQGQLKLVDYDCMYVPSLVKKQNLEIGVDPYQHPGRNSDTILNPNLDNFSALFIFAALKALTAAPDLWETFVEQTEYDKLLFRREDIDEPSSSELIQTLKLSPDSEVPDLCKKLVELARGDIYQVPRLNDVLFDFKNVEVLLGQRDFDGAVELLTRYKKQAAEASKVLQPRILDAQKRVNLRLELERAVNSGDEAAMGRLYDPKLLDDYQKAQPLVVVAKLAPRVIPVLAKLKTTSQSTQWREFVKVWSANSTLLDKRKSAESYSVLARTWQSKNRALDDVLTHLRNPDDGDTTLLDQAWKQLEQLGGHPEAAVSRSQVEKILTRGRAWSGFRKITGLPSEETDTLLDQYWDETLFTGWPLAQAEKPRVVQARQRLKPLAQIAQQVASAPSLATESEIERLAGGLPPGYAFAHQNRAKKSHELLAELRRLLQTLPEPASDMAIAASCKKLGQLGGHPLVPPEHAPRIRLANQRVPILESLKAIPTNYPIQQAPQLDAALLNAWNGPLLDGCHEAQPWRSVYQTAELRRTTLDKLKAAILAGNREQIFDISEEPALRGYPLSVEWSRAVKDSQVHLASIRRNLDALKSGDRAGYMKVFDAGVIVRNQQSFAPEFEKLRSWFGKEPISAADVGLGFPRAQKAIAKEPVNDSAYRFRWNWPDARFGDQCLFVICRQRPATSVDPRLGSPDHRRRITRKAYEGAEGSQVVHIDKAWLGGYVIVWALIDLGFETFWSEPLVLGRLEPALASTTRKKFGGFG